MNQTIHAEELATLHSQNDVELIDVRAPIEFREVHAEIAQNIPLARLDPHAIMKSRDTASAPLYVICKEGGRGEKARQKFVDAGYDNVVNVEGGTTAWIAAGLPVVRGKKAVSIERQVRIVAGTMILVFGVLAMTVNPYFAGVSAFMGAGLAFAGFTDTCGMGMMLARMPWNQVTADESPATASCTLQGASR